MDEDDIDYAPPDEVFYWPSTGVSMETRREWAGYAQIDRWATIKPPPWWLVQQDGMGRGAAKFQIWHNRYKPEKKLSKWLLAPLDDFRRAGYLLRRGT